MITTRPGQRKNRGPAERRKALKAGDPVALRLDEGRLEILKWIGLLLMTLDHVNKYLFDAQLPGLFQAGRLAMPIFGFVLAYHLACPPGPETRSRRPRMAQRLAVAAVAATPVHVLLVGWWPLNFLFALLLVVLIVHCRERGSRLGWLVAAALFLMGGLLVEYWWFGLWTCLAAWAYCRRPDAWRLALWTTATASLGVINANLWSLAAIPLIVVAARRAPRAPRSGSFFYLYYPAHLALIALLSWASAA